MYYFENREKINKCYFKKRYRFFKSEKKSCPFGIQETLSYLLNVCKGRDLK